MLAHDHTHAVDQRSLAGLVRARAAADPRRTAFRYKGHGVWHDTSWAECEARMSAIASGLRAHGLEPGDCVVVSASASPAWVVGLLGAHAAGAVPLTIYQGFAVEDLAAIFEDQAPKATIAEAAWLEMLIEDGVALPELIVLTDQHRPADWPRDDAMMLADVEARGRREPRAAEDSSVEAAAVLVCTAGTKSRPKVVAHSTRSLLASARAVADLGPGLRPVGAQDTVVVEMPTGHLGALLTAIILPLTCGVIAHLPDGRAADAMREVHPSVSINLATAWERTAARVQVLARSRRGLKGAAFRLAQRLRRPASGPEPPSLGLAGALANFAYAVVFLPLLAKLGLEQLRVAYVVGPTAPEELSIWRVWGVKLTHAYGLAEAGPVVGRAVAGAVKPADGMELTAGPDGSLRVRGESVCLGYRSQGRVRPANGTGGWLETGDTCDTGDAGVRVLGPREDLVAIAGAAVSLNLVDAALRYSPYIRSAITTVSDDGSLEAVLDLDFGSLARWATASGISYRTPGALLESDAVSRLLQTELEQANDRLRRRGLPPVRTLAVAPERLRTGVELTPVGSSRQRPVGDTAERETTNAL
jgi:long-chain acyl-CoA synthetase